MGQTTPIRATSLHTAAFVLAALATLLPAAASADDTDLAKRYFKLGEELYNRADYAGALEQFGKAHKHSGKPEMLFNIGRCQESLGQHTAAIKTYKAFLASGPPNREQVEARIANLEQHSKRPPAAVAAPPAAKQQRQPTPRQPAPPRRSSTKGLVGWISAGAGAALLVTGVVLGALAQGKADEMEEANKANDTYADHRDVEAAGQDLQLGQIVTLAAGGAALVAGGVLLYLHYRTGSERPQNAAWFAPTPARGGALVSGGFRF